MTTSTVLTDARAEARFISDLSASFEPTAEQVAAAIRGAVHRHGGTRGCAAEVAARYGEHPETAAPRMWWARRVVETAYATGPTDLHPAALPHTAASGESGVKVHESHGSA
jgi:hypothetical protein